MHQTSERQSNDVCNKINEESAVVLHQRPTRSCTIKSKQLQEQVVLSSEETDESSSEEEDEYEYEGKKTNKDKTMRTPQHLQLQSHPILKSKVNLKQSITLRGIPQEALKPSKLFVIVQKGSLEQVTPMLTQWHSQYEENRDRICLQLFNFVLEASGFPGNFVSFEDAEGKTPQEVLDEALGTLDLQGFSLGPKFSLKTNERGMVQFPMWFRQFWSLLVATFDEDIVVGNLYKDLAIRLLPLTGHRIRNLRHTGTVAGFAFCEGILDLFVAARENKERYSVQLNAETSSKSKSTIFKTLMEKIRSCEEIVEKYQQCILDLSVALLTRWRDRCPAIRRETYEALFRAIRKCPDLFIADSKKCRYIGWALYDRDSSIRILASQFLSEAMYVDKIFELLRRPMKGHAASSGPSFLSGFLVRLVELPKDVEPKVRVCGVKLLTKLAECDLLSDEQIEQIAECLWECPSYLELRQLNAKDHDTFQELRNYLAVFVNSTTFANSIIREWPREFGNTSSGDLDTSTEHQRDALDLRALLEFIVEFAEKYVVLIDRLVSAFWDKACALRCVGSLVDFLIVGDCSNQIASPLEDKYRIPLMALTLSAYRHLDLSSNVDGSTGVPSRTTTRWLEESTSTILKRIPSILRVCKAEPTMLALASSVIFHASLNVDLVCHQMDLQQGIKALSESFLSCSSIIAFDSLGAAIANLIVADEKNLKAAEEHIINKIVRELYRINFDIKKETSPELLQRYWAEFGFCLRRLYAIATSASYNLFWNHEGVIEVLLDLCASRKRDSQYISSFITMVALQCLTVAIFHLEADVQELVEELQSEFAGVLVNQTAAKTTDRNSVVQQLVIPTESGSNPNRRKRGCSDDQEILSGRAIKRRRERDSIVMYDNDGIHDAEKLKSLIESRWNRFISWHDSLRKCCLGLLDEDQCPYVQYIACTSILAPMKLSNRDPAKRGFEQSWMAVQRQLKTTREELRVITKYLKRCIGELEEMFHNKNRHIEEIRLSTLTQKLSLFSLASLVKSQIPVIDGILNGEIQLDVGSEQLVSDSPAFQRFVLSRIIYLSRLTEDIGDKDILCSNITPLFFSIWWFNHPDINDAMSQYFNSIIARNDETTFWTIILNTLEAMVKDPKQRHRLRWTIVRFAKSLPTNFVSVHRLGFFDFVVKVASNHLLAKSMAPSVIYFIPTNQNRQEVFEDLKVRATQEESDLVRQFLTTCFRDKKVASWDTCRSEEA